MNHPHGEGDRPPDSGRTSSVPPSSLPYPSRRSREALCVYTFDDLLGHLERARDRTRRTPDLGAHYAALEGLARERVERLWAAVRLSRAGDGHEAAREAEALARGLPDEEDGHGALVARTFAEALLARIRKAAEGGGNLYLDARPPGAQLRAFELLRLRTPLIPFAYAAANRALLEGLDEPTDVTLVDVGIGRGGQVRALLRNPSARRVLRSLHVIGVEPDSSPDTGGALEIAQTNVIAAAEEARVPVTFAGIPRRAEQLRAIDLRAAGPRGLVLANASLSLHHVGRLEHGAESDRTDVLATLREAGAARVVLVEPDTDHDQEDLALRFLYAFRHYGTIARGLSATLAPTDAALVWGEFFAQEVRNVTTYDGPLRTERHEEIATWAARLEEVGFTVDTPADLAARAAAPAGFTVRDDGRSCSLCYDGVSLVGVLRGRRR